MPVGGLLLEEALYTRRLQSLAIVLRREGRIFLVKMSYHACQVLAPTGTFHDVIVSAARLTPAFNASVGIAGAIIALLSCIVFTRAVLKESPGNSEMQRIRGLIYDGARTYLNTQCE
jgi:hypothetical protein